MSVAFLLALPSLINAGTATIEQVRSMIQSIHPGLTDAETDAILELVKADAARRKALAHADQQPNV